MGLPTRVQKHFDPFESAQTEFDSMLGRLFTGRMGDGGIGQLAPFAVDVREDTDHLYVEADMPGYKKEEIDINIENQMLTIVAEHKEHADEESHNKGDWLLRERRYSRFQRSFTLPPTVDAGSVVAKLNDGVLLITLDKREESKPRKITVA